MTHDPLPPAPAPSRGARRIALRRLRRSRSTLAALALSGWAFALLGAVASGPGARVAVVDPARVTAESKTIQAALARAASPVEALSRELKEKQARRAEAGETYAAQKSAASAAENERRVAELRRMDEEIADLARRAGEALKDADEATLRPHRDRILEAVRRVAEPRGIGVVLRVENTVHYDPSLDLTAEVVARIDGDAEPPAKTPGGARR